MDIYILRSDDGIMSQDFRERIDHDNDKGRRQLYEDVSLILETYLGKIAKQIEELTQ